MAANEIHVDDVGTIYRATITDNGTVVDISTVTTKQFIIRKPDGTLLTVAASFTNSGTDGKMQYTFVAGDLSLVGYYRIQAYLVFSATQKWKSDFDQFKVYANN